MADGSIDFVSAEAVRTGILCLNDADSFVAQATEGIKQLVAILKNYQAMTKLAADAEQLAVLEKRLDAFLAKVSCDVGKLDEEAMTIVKRVTDALLQG
jgi:hypothetical protein